MSKNDNFSEEQGIRLSNRCIKNLYKGNDKNHLEITQTEEGVSCDCKLGFTSDIDYCAFSKTNRGVNYKHGCSYHLFIEEIENAVENGATIAKINDFYINLKKALLDILKNGKKGEIRKI